MLMKREMIEQYLEKYSATAEEAVRVFMAPGRVNLIGEHTDYNGGHVFPCALTLGTYAAAAQNTEGVIRLFSENFKKEGVRTFGLCDYRYNESNGWTNYVLGVIDQFMKAGHKIDKGFNVYLKGNIPNGAGLSSSASLELVIAMIVNVFYKLDLPMIELVKLCQRAENEFIGVQCGIMDQFAIGMGKKDHAILLNTNTLKYIHSRLPIEGYSLVIANTNKRRGLAESKYNERRSECESALLDLKKETAIQSLGDLTNEAFDQLAAAIKDPIARKRAKHAVYENQRTIKAYEVLMANDLEAFGQLMNASHRSLRDDYEVSCNELDILTELSWAQPGVLGSRMTGAGFGGCTVSLVKRNLVPAFVEAVGKGYAEQTDYQADFYIASIGDGVREL